MVPTGAAEVTVVMVVCRAVLAVVTVVVLLVASAATGLAEAMVRRQLAMRRAGELRCMADDSCVMLLRRYESRTVLAGLVKLKSVDPIELWEVGCDRRKEK